MSVELHRWHIPTLTQAIVPMRTTCFGCARCGGLVPAHLAERDYATGEWVHAGNCPYVAKVTFPAEPVAALPPLAPRPPALPRQMRPRPTPKPDPASVEEVMRIVARHAAKLPPAVPPTPTPETIRQLHEDARRRALERQRAADEEAARDARQAG